VYSCLALLNKISFQTEGVLAGHAEPFLSVPFSYYLHDTSIEVIAQTLKKKK